MNVLFFGVEAGTDTGTGRFFCTRCRRVNVHSYKYKYKALKVLFMNMGKGFEELELKCGTCFNKKILNGEPLKHYFLYLKDENNVDGSVDEFLQNLAAKAK